jgi:Domain of unknown function (DUF5664)
MPEAEHWNAELLRKQVERQRAIDLFAPPRPTVEGAEMEPVTTPSGFVTKDSGVREEYESGMRRDTQAGKPRFDLMYPDYVPYDKQFLTRVAELMTRGADKYGDRNWEKADSEEELNRFRASALRHCMQWFHGEMDEDHSAAVVFNLLAYESTKWKLSK